MFPEDVVSKFLHAQTNIIMSSNQNTAPLAGVAHLLRVSFEPNK